MKYIRLMFLVSLAVYMSSCAPQQQVSKYLGEARDTSGLELDIPELLIQRNDLLSIQVYSLATKAEVDALYNLPCAGSPVAGAAGQQGAVGPCGFLVDAAGNIEYPRIGLLHVQGLNKQQLSDLIKRKINEKDTVLREPSVIVRFQNLKVLVMGEVKSPGVQSFPGERITILEAIGLAGDVTDFGIKEKVKVIREVNGKRQIATVNLSSTDLFTSPFYNLMQNDVVVVDPSVRKTKQQDQALVYQKISLGLSIITAFALIYNVFQ
ncbi:MAG: polysaccharide export protein [Chitinophagaceae bacterium]|nr:MAG: polysaccharide export protein [Chitinophagaceae bacterium]